MKNSKDRRKAASAEPDIDPRILQEISGCTCLRLRRTARQVTRIYDQHFSTTDITSSQFGLLTYLTAAPYLGAEDGFSIGQLADRLGMDPTTLNRNLKPLLASRLVADHADATDARIRKVSITESGRRTLATALPHWRAAQAEVAKALGPAPLHDLNQLLDQATEALVG
jgi:DNA-binding MarR family transcriptional regulator